jgi:uncharacterized protein YdhG (YjbR/CyaY superfamily)
MAKTDFQSVNEYVAALPPHVRTALERVRATIRKAVPAAEETISYQIAAFKMGDRVALYLAGWKEHVSLYPVGAELLAAFGDEIAPYVAGKGTLRFPLSERLPLGLIARIAKFRAAEAAAKPPAKKAVKKSAPPRNAKPRAKPAARRGAASRARH